jgi:pilus assembly protein FimV
MILNNKLKLAILAVFASQSISAITIDPVHIQSAPGELLYAELKFRNAAPNERLDVSLATPEELASIGVYHQPPGHLNFYTRRSSSGEGVITITSSRPMTQTELNIVVKVQAGDSARLQHIRKPLSRSNTLTATQPQQSSKNNETALQPVMIVSEKEIALNLPVSTQYKPAAKIETPTENLLQVRQALPPSLQSKEAEKSTPAQSIAPAIQAQVVTPQTIEDANVQTATTNKVPNITEPSPETTFIPTPVKVEPEPKAADQPNHELKLSPEPEIAAAPSKPEPTTNSVVPKTTPETQQHVVRSNESLWKIADRIAKQQNRPIQDVMQQIKKDNEHAFVKGDMNRLRRGVTLNLGATPTQQNPEIQKRQIAEMARSLPSTQSGKAKYRLNQAEMSLVAENQQDSTHASAMKDTKTNKTSKELSLKVMTAREKTVKLQRNVTQLELALNQKDHRIQLLNARLAQLQQQLKAQQADKKPKL